MKLDSLEPNAHYDMEHGMPAVLEKDNDGSVIYRVKMNTSNGEIATKAKKLIILSNK